MYKNNLWRAFLQLMQSKSFKMAIFNLDRLGNALAAGHYRATISARVGYQALIKHNRYWLFLQWVIDQTFRPIDGRRHCYRAFKIERNLDIKHRRGNDIALALLSVLVLAGSLLLAPIIYVVGRFKS